jgi:Skp family chaperone for outer membrane proteins
MNKGKVRDNERVIQKREVLNKILILTKKSKQSEYYKKLNKKSRKELQIILKRLEEKCH